MEACENYDISTSRLTAERSASELTSHMSSTRIALERPTPSVFYEAPIFIQKENTRTCPSVHSCRHPLEHNRRNQKKEVHSRWSVAKVEGFAPSPTVLETVMLLLRQTNVWCGDCRPAASRRRRYERMPSNSKCWHSSQDLHLYRESQSLACCCYTRAAYQRYHNIMIKSPFPLQFLSFYRLICPQSRRVNSNSALSLILYT